MDIIYFLIAVVFVTGGVLWLVGKSSKSSERRKLASKRHTAPHYRTKSATHSLQHGHLGHTDVSKSRDIWHGRRKHATDRAEEKSSITGSFTASRVLFDGERDEPTDQVDDLAMTSIEYRSDEFGNTARSKP